MILQLGLSCRAHPDQHGSPGLTAAPVHRAVQSKDGNLAAVHGWTHVNPLFWAPFLPVIHVQIVSFVHMTRTKGLCCAVLCCAAALRKPKTLARRTCLYADQQHCVEGRFLLCFV